ncbi:hypothetical protein Btru_007207 [Bulinus truncatus]|nr:hypothetical protein Btru_007207 [Bulinus truncatus]
MKVTTLLASCIAWFAIFIHSIDSETTPCYPCDPAWPRPIYYPDFTDCAYIWECNNGNLTKTSCDAGLVFDFLMQGCVTDGPEMLFTCKKLLNKSTCP